MGVCNTKEDRQINSPNHQASPGSNTKITDETKGNPFLSAAQRHYQSNGNLSTHPTQNQDNLTESTKKKRLTSKGEPGTQNQSSSTVKIDHPDGNHLKKPEEPLTNQQPALSKSQNTTAKDKIDTQTQQTKSSPQNKESPLEKDQSTSQIKPNSLGHSTTTHRNPFTAAAKRNTAGNIPFKGVQTETIVQEETIIQKETSAQKETIIQEEVKSSKKIISIANSKDTQTFLFIDKKQLAESFYLELDKGDEEILSLRKVTELITTKLTKISIHIQATYYSDTVDLEKTLAYYADCAPFYFQLTKIYAVKCQSKIPSHELEAFEIEVSSHQPVLSLYEQVQKQLKLEKKSFHILLNRAGKDPYIVPRSSKTLKLSDEDLAGASLVVQLIGEDVPIKVKLTAETNISLSSSLDSSVEELLDKIREINFIDLGQTNLKFEGKQLEHRKTLKEYDIKADSELELVSTTERKRQYVDALNSNKGEKIQLNDSGLAWREVSPGICIEGKCTNEKCPSFGNGNVILQLGYGSFDLIADSKTCKCPICNFYFEPVVFAVNNSEYIISGIHKGKETKDTRYTKQLWKSVGDEYIAVNPHKEEPEGWKSLKLHARKSQKTKLEKLQSQELNVRFAELLLSQNTQIVADIIIIRSA